MDTNAAPVPPSSNASQSVPAGKLTPWQVGELPPPPSFGARHWMALIGPGILMAGVSIGSGEWLFGPAVTGRYGATLMWLATMSIGAQVFFNLEVMRYTLYCGEPIFVGYFRTWPGPRFWTPWYMILDISNIWPFMAANAAVPVAAAFLGHLPGNELLFGTLSETMFVKVLGYVVFVLAFVPLIFGGTIYRMVERIMTIKILLVLGLLSLATFFMVSRQNAQEVIAGFFRFGAIPLRAETVIAGPHFTLLERDGGAQYTIKGTVEDNGPLVTEFAVDQDGEVTKFKMNVTPPETLEPIRARMLERAISLAKEGRFYVEDSRADGTIQIHGRIVGGSQREPERWEADEIVVIDAGVETRYDRDHLEDVPQPMAERARAFTSHLGIERTSLFRYIRQHGRLPNLDWITLASFAAIAGTGGLTNTLLSNYARDKGWGMGKHVGAIPSAIGGRTISLSHVGMVFHPTESTRGRWRGWIRHIVRDQLVVWTVCCFIGMALPCMLSLEFIRNVPVEGNRVAALTAEGIANRYPEYRQFFWLLTLLCGFLVLAPGAMFTGEGIARRWTDVLWTTSPYVQHMKGHQVSYIYYGILALYAVWGMLALWLFEPLQIAKIAAVLMNVALGFGAFHTFHVNRTLLPKPLRPNLLMQAGLLYCGCFYLGITAIVIAYL